MGELKSSWETPQSEPINTGWRVVAESIQGTSHEKTGQVCQDAHHWQCIQTDILVAAIADGAGSAPLGDVGAAIATQVAVETICTQLKSAGTEIARSPEAETTWKTWLTEALQAAQAAVESAAADQQESVRDLAATLIVLVATPELVAVAQVGDGAAVIGDDEGAIAALTTPQQGEYTNETVFLISPNALETAQVNIWYGQAQHIAVFSDGLQRLALKFPEGNPHLPFFAPLFRFVTETTDETVAHEQLSAFLRSPRLLERTDDDLTLLLATWTR